MACLITDEYCTTKAIILTARSDGVIYRCQDGHISFSKGLRHCGMKGCERPADVISETDIDWFYKISPEGLAINEKDLDMIIGDRNMPKDVKDAIKQVFPGLKKKRFWQR